MKEGVGGEDGYGEWLKRKGIEVEKVGRGGKVENGVEKVSGKELEFGFGEEDMEGSMMGMGRKGEEGSGCMGNDSGVGVV